MFELSYGGLPLCVPTPEVMAWVRRVLPRQALTFPGPLGWPASSLAGPAAITTPVRRQGRVGSLYWPTGVSRCAVGHFLASRTQLDQIQAAMPNGEPATLKLDTGNEDGFVSTSMLMLPPLPLSGGVASINNDPAFLITLVDDRYQWWSAVTDDTLTVDGDTTPWNDLIDALATLLGITITADTVDTAAFGYASDGMDLSGLPAVVVLDAVCYACGLRISRRLDGTVHAKTCDNDYATLASNLDYEWPSASGGEFRLDPDGLPSDATAPADQPLVLPETVSLVVQDDSGQNTVNVAVPSTDPLITNDRTGGTRAWFTHRATYDATREGDYADAFTRDYAIRLISAVSRCFAGIVPWRPEGTSDAVEWIYTERRAATIIHLAPWSDGITEIVGKAASSSASGPCTATCVDLIDYTSLVSTPNNTTCTSKVAYNAPTYCGPWCVSETPCPEEEDGCTTCVPIYAAGSANVGDAGPEVTNVGTLTGVFNPTDCTTSYTSSPKKQLRGCFTVSSTWAVGSIAIIDTTQPFFSTRDPDDCDAPEVWTYSLLYLTGAISRVDSPYRPDFPSAGKMHAIHADLVPDRPDIGTGQRNANAINQILLDAIAPSSPADPPAELRLPAGVLWVTLDGATPGLTADHSGLTIVGVPGRTEIRATNHPTGLAGFWVSNSLSGDPIGYLQGFVPLSSTTFTASDQVYSTISRTAVDVSEDLVVGDVVCLGWGLGGGGGVTQTLTQQMLLITANTPTSSVTATITVDGTINPAWYDPYGLFKVLRNSALVDSVSADGTTITLTDPTKATRFVAGEPVIATNGFAINDLYGEPTFCVSSDDGTGEVVVMPPLRRYYDPALTMALCAGPFLRKVAFRGVDQNYFPSRAAFGIVVEDSHYHDYPGGLNWAMTRDGIIRRCRGHLEFDCCYNITIEDCLEGVDIAFTEWSRGLTIRNSLVVGTMFLLIGSDGLIAENCDFRWNATGSYGGAFYGTGDEIGPKIRGCRVWTNCYAVSIGGQNLEFAGNYLHDGISLLVSGENGFIAGNYGAGTITLLPGSTGILGPNTCPVVDSSGNGWRQAVEHIGGAVTADLTFSGNILLPGAMTSFADPPTAAKVFSGQFWVDTGASNVVKMITTSPFLTNLAAFWSMRDAAGVTVIDELGVSNLTDHGTVGTNNSNVFGGTTKFFDDSLSNYADHADSATLRMGDIDFTIAGVASIFSTADHAFISKGDASNLDYFLDYHSGYIRFHVYVAPTLYTVLVPWLYTDGLATIQAWHDSTADTINLTVNGVTATPVSTGGGAPTTTATPFRMGVSHGLTEYHRGLMGPWGLWKGLWTADMATAFHARNPRFRYPF